MALDLTRFMTVDAEQARDIVVSVQQRFAEAGYPFTARLWDGTELGPDDAGYRLVLHHPWSVRAMVIPGTDLATGEAYVFDAFDIEGSMVQALRTVARMHNSTLPWRDRLWLTAQVLRLPSPPPRAEWRRAKLEGSVHSKGRDAAAVRFHYDVGNDFYRLFLDDRLVYSCAYFDEGPLDRPVDPLSDELNRAQLRKLDLVCRKLRLQPEERFLDVGCGWGSLVLHAAERYGVRAVGITLSEEQADLARKQIVEADLADRVEIRVRDYRDAVGQFDAVASIGMFEHVGADHHADYFTKMRELTVPGGRFLNHGITTGARQEVRDLSAEEDSFVAKYVFPDGALVPAWQAARQMEEAGFELRDVEQLRPHYARTLRYWVSRLEHHADEARRIAGDISYRVWRAYMSGSVVGFETDDLGVVQVLGVAGPPTAGGVLPPGRSWMTPQVD